jgi:hypothetical protein
MANNTGIKYGFTELLEGNMGRVQELIYLRYEKGINFSFLHLDIL